MKARSILFLKDILVIAITAFGGPQAHLVQMIKYLVHKHKFITEDDLMETVAFCQMLPGPSSTQTVTAIAFKKGGVLLAILSLIIWILPATALMTAITLVFAMFERNNFSIAFLRYMQPMAIGFIAFAGYKIGIAVIKTKMTFFIMLGSCLLSIIFRNPFIFPAILIAGGVISTFTNRKDHKTDAERSLFSWTNFWVSISLFAGIFVLAAVLGALTKSQPVVLFENFYRFGAITFGGGQVLVPLMFEQFVLHNHYLKPDEFISGYAFNQAVPGPTFSFAAFTGGLALRHLGMQYIFTGCIIATVAIYLPGALLVLFLYPLWQYIKNYKYIYRSLAGVNAAATGLVFGAAYNIYIALNFAWANIFIVIAAFGLLLLTKIPPPVLVLIALAAGFIFSL
jgi:chromate transporter